jgi:hypothetical protein
VGTPPDAGHPALAAIDAETVRALRAERAALHALCTQVLAETAWVPATAAVTPARVAALRQALAAVVAPAGGPR